MPEIKNLSVKMQAVSGASVTPTLLSSDDVVRIISSHVLSVRVAGQIRISGEVNVHLVDSATGQVIKSISSLSDAVSSLSDAVISDPALPAATLNFLQTPLGSAIFAVILGAAINIPFVLYEQQHSEDASKRQTEQFVKQMAQSVEQLFLSHSEQVPSSPTPPPTPPQGD